jgi:hypothetical protein
MTLLIAPESYHAEYTREVTEDGHRVIRRTSASRVRIDPETGDSFTETWTPEQGWKEQR